MATAFLSLCLVMAAPVTGLVSGMNAQAVEAYADATGVTAATTELINKNLASIETERDAMELEVDGLNSEIWSAFAKVLEETHAVNPTSVEEISPFAKTVAEPILQRINKLKAVHPEKATPEVLLDMDNGGDVEQLEEEKEELEKEFDTFMAPTSTPDAVHASSALQADDKNSPMGRAKKFLKLTKKIKEFKKKSKKQKEQEEEKFRPFVGRLCKTARTQLYLASTAFCGYLFNYDDVKTAADCQFSMLVPFEVNCFGKGVLPPKVEAIPNNVNKAALGLAAGVGKVVAADMAYGAALEFAQKQLNK